MRQETRKNWIEKNELTYIKLKKLFKQWCHQNETNYKDKYELLKGTYYEYKGKYALAEKEYKLCIESANENDQLPIQALAYEKLAKIQTNTNEKQKIFYKINQVI